MRITVVCILFVTFSHVSDFVSGAAMHEELKTEIDNGKTVKYCEYKGLRLLRRSKFKDYDNCSKCVCDKNGLSCYTMFPLMMVPEESQCDYIIAGCKVKWVLKKNNKIRCPKDMIPDI